MKESFTGYKTLILLYTKNTTAFSNGCKDEGVIIMARSSNKLLVPGIEQALNEVKYEIAREFGVNLGSDTSSRANGSVGGEITKRLIAQAQQQQNNWKS